MVVNVCACLAHVSLARPRPNIRAEGLHFIISVVVSQTMRTLLCMYVLCVYVHVGLSLSMSPPPAVLSAENAILPPTLAPHTLKEGLVEKKGHSVAFLMWPELVPPLHIHVHVYTYTNKPTRELRNGLHEKGDKIGMARS